jgi:subtilisin family serine protease
MFGSLPEEDGACCRWFTEMTRRMPLTPVLLSVFGLLTAPAAGMAAPPQADTVLVKLDADATRADRAEVTNLLDAEASRGLPAGWRAYRLPDRVTLGEARTLLQDTDADRAVELDGEIRTRLTPNDADFSMLFAMPLIQATTAWDLTPQGPPVVVAVVDTGVDVSHPDLSGMIWSNPGEVANGADDDGNGLVDDLQGWDFYNNNSSVYDSPSVDDHGTHVAGTIGATRSNTIGVAGVADNVRLMPVKFLGGADGQGTTSGAINAITYARQKGARIINASWGGPDHSDALCDAVSAAVSAGVLFVAAAGNDGEDNDVVVSDPADCPSPGVVSVAASTSADTLAGFSNFGLTTVDLGAPGQSIHSTLPGGTYGAFSGTSMAAPHVSGAAALVLGQVPTLSPTALRSALMGGGTAVASLAGSTVSGRRLSALGAINQASDPSGDVMPPLDFVPSAPADAALTPARPTFTWTEAVDLESGVARYRLILDGATVAETAADILNARAPIDLSEGSHTWQVEAEDRAGNRRSTAGRTVLVDSGPPQAFALDTPAPGAAKNSRRPVFGWAESVDRGAGIAGYRLVIDGARSPTYSPTTRAASPEAPLADGPHLWQVEAVDRLGLVQPSEARTVIVDAAAPTAFGLRTPLDGIRLRSRRPGFAWSPSKDLAGSLTYQVVLNGKVRATGLTRPSWRPPAALRPGYYQWKVNAVDAAGNVRSSPKEYFSIAKPRPKKRAKKK